MLPDDVLPDDPSDGTMEGDGVHELFIKLIKEYAPENPADIALIASLIGLDMKETTGVLSEQAASRYHHRYLHQEGGFAASVFSVMQWLDEHAEKHKAMEMPARALRSAAEEGTMRLIHRASLRYGGYKNIPNRQAQAWETMAQSLASLARQRAVLSRNPHLKRCHSAKPRCTVDGCDGDHRKQRRPDKRSTEPQAGDAAQGGDQEAAGVSKRAQRQTALRHVGQWEWEKLQAWLLAETGRASRHKSRDTCLEKVVKVWPGTPSKHRDVSMEEDGKGEEERARSDLGGETEDEEEEMANVEAEFDSDDATL